MTTRKQQGFALIEVMVASVVMFIIFSALITLYTVFLQQSQTTQLMSKRERQVASMIDSIRNNAKYYQANFSSSVTPIDLNNLPIGWDESSWGPANVEPFQSLPGRAGFSISQLPRNSRLLVVSLTIRHPKIANTQKIYTFMVSADE